MREDLRKKVKYALISFAFLFVAVICFAIGSLILWWGQSTGWLLSAFEWLQSIGYWANVVIIILYTPTSFPLIMGYALLPILSGFLFGFWLGMAVYIFVNYLFRGRTEKVSFSLFVFIHESHSNRLTRISAVYSKLWKTCKCHHGRDNNPQS
jgi:MFS family permease